ncbi:MAG: hypothetical protein AAB337_01305 [Patescibacteria group bacterium]
MSENVIYNREEVWDELLERVRAQGIAEVGELDEDQEIAELAAEFKERWGDIHL